MRARKQPPAEPPVNVVLHYVGGERVPVDCVYVGWSSTERVHVWSAINPRPTAQVSSLTVDILPAYTRIAVERTSLAFHEDDDDD